MVKALFISVLFFSIALQLNAQRISAGFHLGTGVSQTFDYNSDFIFPEYSYNIYYTVVEDETKRTNSLTGFNIGYYLQIDYKQLYFGSEINIATHKYSNQLLFAQVNEWDFFGPQGWVEINVKQSGMEIPLFLGYKFLQSNFNISLFAGATYCGLISSEEDGYLNLNSDLMVQAFMGFYELYGIVYNNKSYWRTLTGIGFHYKDHSLSLRYEYRLNNQENYLPVTHSQFTLNYNWIINFQKMKKGHYIYTE